MMEKVLQNIGLSENETKTYLALLPLERSCVSILGNKMNLPRNTVRTACISLRKKGLIKEKKIKNTFFYSANSPDRLKEMLVEKEHKIKREQKEIEKYIPQLKTIEDPNYLIPQVQYFEGVEGMKTVYEDILCHGKDVYCWTNFTEKSNCFDLEYIENYIKRRIGKGIKVFAIQSKNDDEHNTFNIFHQLNCESAILDDLFLNNGEIRVYANKIAFINFENKDKVQSYVIEDHTVASMLRAILKSHIKLARLR